MDFKNVFIQVNEVIHKSIQNFKEEIISNDKFPEITINQLFYIEAISNLENPTLSDLSNHLNLSNPSVSNAVQKLINKGFISKFQSAEDKRVFHIKLEKCGLMIIDAEKKALNKFINELENSLTEDEKAVFINVFEKFLKNYRKQHM